MSSTCLAQQSAGSHVQHTRLVGLRQQTRPMIKGWIEEGEDGRAGGRTEMVIVRAQLG